MKAYFFSGLIFSLLFISCNTEDIETENNIKNFDTKTSGIADKGDAAANAANEFDVAGRLYVKLTENYNESGTATQAAIISNIEANASANADFVAISNGYTGINVNQLQWVLDNADTPTTVIAMGSTAQVRQKLATLLSIIESNQSTSFQQLYSALVSFEQSIINSPVLSPTEKKTLLVNSSIARYAYYKTSNGGGITGGWNKLKTSIYGSITGAETNMATAITLSVSAGIASGN